MKFIGWPPGKENAPAGVAVMARAGFRELKMTKPLEYR
jgi:hypothetical protein